LGQLSLSGFITRTVVVYCTRLLYMCRPAGIGHPRNGQLLSTACVNSRTVVLQGGYSHLVCTSEIPFLCYVPLLLLLFHDIPIPLCRTIVRCHAVWPASARPKSWKKGGDILVRTPNRHRRQAEASQGKSARDEGLIFRLSNGTNHCTISSI
jgi:hypothetical protein